MIDLAAAVIEKRREKISNYPQHVNRASECGDPCEKYLVLSRTNWEDKTPHEIGLQFIFDRGNTMEDVALAELRGAGFEVVQTQRPFVWKDIELTGRIDAMLQMDGTLYPLEIKALSPFYFDKLNSVEDMLKSDRPWVRKYPAQLMMYMLLSGHEHGVFYLKNALTWWPRTIWVDLDYDYADGIVKKLERVNQHVKDGTQPEGINNAETCPRCNFFHICRPEILRDALRFEDDPELEGMLLRREELSPLAAEYRKIDDTLKTKLEGCEKAVVGDFLITGKYTERKSYTVEAGLSWRKSIKRI